MRVLTFFIVAGLIVGGFWYYWWNVQQPNVPKSEEDIIVQSQRSPIVPSTFTRASTLSSLKKFQEESPNFHYFAEYGNASGTIITLSELPQDILKFVVPEPQGEVEVNKVGQNPEYYYAHYFSEVAMPDNSPRFSRLADPKEYKVIYGFRNQLASVLEVESVSYIIRISQLTISEDRTEVMIHARKK